MSIGTDGSLRSLLENVMIRLPNQNRREILKTVIEDGILMPWFDEQYLDKVEFIPSFRPSSKLHPFYHIKKDARPDQRHPLEKTQEPVKVDGFDHELLVQDLFANLISKSKLFEKKMTIFHNIDAGNLDDDILNKDVFSSFKGQFNKEFDLIICDENYGVLLVELKNIDYRKFKKTGKIKIEAKKMKERKAILSALSNVAGVNVPIIPIIMTTCSDEDEDFVLKDSPESYCVGVNFQRSSVRFDEVWSNILNTICNQINHPEAADVRKCAVALNSLCRFSSTSELHFNFAGGSVSEPGGYQHTNKKLANTSTANLSFREEPRTIGGKTVGIIWTKQQSEVLEYIEETFKDNNPLRLEVRGCLGSGKTLLLVEAARYFKRLFPSGETYFMLLHHGNDMGEERKTLLETQLEIRFKPISINKNRGCIFCPRPQETPMLLLIDEVRAHNVFGSNTRPCQAICEEHQKKNNVHIVVANSTNMNIASEINGCQLKAMDLNGNLRSSENICQYLIKETMLGMDVELELVQCHNIRGGPEVSVPDDITFTYTDSGHDDFKTVWEKKVLKEITTFLDGILDNLKPNAKKDKLKVFVIFDSQTGDNYIYPYIRRECKKLTDYESFPYDFSMDSFLRGYDRKNQLTIVFGNVYHFMGDEASTVIYVTSDLHTRSLYNNSVRTNTLSSLACSRATVNLLVLNIRRLDTWSTESD